MERGECMRGREGGGRNWRGLRGREGEDGSREGMDLGRGSEEGGKSLRERGRGGEGERGRLASRGMPASPLLLNHPCVHEIKSPT